MPFKSEKQRKWMHANKPKMAKKWEKEEESVTEAVKDPKLKVGQKIRHKSDPRRLYILKKITHGNSGIPEDPAGTSYMFVAPGNRKEYHTKKTWAQAIKKGWIIPESVSEDRDYKDEYKKFQSSTKAKKYRAELNQYNRKKGTYGNGDGKDASHKGGKIVGFEAESKNRGRAEKSRLRKEDITMLEAKFTDDTLAPRIKHWASKHKGTGIGYGHVLGQLAVHMKEMGWNKSYKEVARVAIELGKKKKVESVDEGTCGYTHTIDGKKLKTPGGINDDDIDKTESIIVEFDKYRLGGLLDSKLKKRLERTIKIIGGKVDAVGDDYVKFRIGGMDLSRLPAVITKLDRNKNVWISDRYNKNIWDRKRNIDRLSEGSKDWEKYFTWANKKQLDVISKFVMMDPEGVKGILKMMKKSPKGFKQFVKDAAKKGLGEGFGGELNEKDKAKFEKARKANAEVLGFELTGVTDVKEFTNEGKWSKIMTSVRKGSKAGPWSIVVYDKAKRKVIHNRIVKILQQIPAHYEDVKKKYPRASIGIEDKHGQRVYTESINEGTKAFRAYREMKEALNVAIYGIKKMRKFIDDAPYNPKFNMITKELYKWEIDLEKKWRRVVPQISKISKDKMLESVNEKMSPAQYHSYMQYVFDTQFKTPDEKKMKKSIIKKINVAQKKKGLPLYKESVNEKWSKGLERYKVTLENGKEIDVKVKEGVGLEGIGKLLEKEGLKFEKITKKASRPTLTPESVNEARETAIDIAKRVVKNKQHEKGLDLTTANFIVKIYDAYKEHPNLQRQMKKMPLPKMVKLAYKVMK